MPSSYYLRMHFHSSRVGYLSTDIFVSPKLSFDSNWDLDIAEFLDF